jgi:biotin operon repressor
MERSTKALAQLKEQGFDVLARAQRVHRKIRAGAEILEQAGTAHCYPVLSTAG